MIKLLFTLSNSTPLVFFFRVRSGFISFFWILFKYIWYSNFLRDMTVWFFVLPVSRISTSVIRIILNSALCRLDIVLYSTVIIDSQSVCYELTNSCRYVSKSIPSCVIISWETDVIFLSLSRRRFLERLTLIWNTKFRGLVILQYKRVVRRRDSLESFAIVTNGTGSTR